MRAAGYAAAFIGGGVICYLLVVVGLIRQLPSIRPPQEELALNIPTYLSFMSVMLTAVTVVLAAVAIFIGIVAAYTFRELSEKAEQAAQRRIDAALSDEKINARIDKIALSRTGRTLPELESGFDPTDKSER